MILWRYGQERHVRQAREQMLMTEGSVLSGVLSAHNVDYRKKRQRELQRGQSRKVTPGASNPNWAQQIAADFPGNVVRGDH